MSKGLESWEEIKAYLEYVLYDKLGTRALGYTSTSGYLQPFIDDVEKKLKALEIIKDQVKVEVREIQGTYYLMVGGLMKSAKPITKEEYDLLKEVWA